MEWPQIDPKNGKPITTQSAKDVWSAFCCGNEELLQSIHTCKNWRTDYMKVVEQLVTYQYTKATPEEAVAMAQAGLDALHSTMNFRVDTHTTIPASEAFNSTTSNNEPTTAYYTTLSQRGSVLPSAQPGYKFPLASPHGTNDSPIFIRGTHAKAQLQAWQDYGCIEESAAHHAGAVCDLEDVTPLVHDKVFVLLGLTSAMGPAKSLLTIPGAYVLGVARAGTKLQRLQQWFFDYGSSEATLVIPSAGADMLLEGPMIAKWIIEQAPPNKELVLCHLAYMDGEAHVRITVAMDCITQYVCSNYQGRVSLSFITSPATVHAIPPQAAQNALQQYKSRSTWELLVSTMSLGKWLQPTNVWSNGGVLNGMAHIQGPNYALAKTTQQWRCMVAQWRQGLTVSAPHGPPTRTESMVCYSTIAAVLEGMQSLEPMVSFDVLPTSSLLTAILLYQLSSSLHSNGPVVLNHPMEVLWDGSVHGGSWRCPYTTESAGTLAYLLGKAMTAPFKPPKSLAPKPDDVAGEEQV